MKPKNFPERKRQRQLGALSRLRLNDNDNREMMVLIERTSTSLRHIRTKIDRSKRGIFKSVQRLD